MADTKNAPGSPDGEPVYLVVGFLRRPHGVRGEIIMDLHTDFPDRRGLPCDLQIAEILDQRLHSYSANSFDQVEANPIAFVDHK